MSKKKISRLAIASLALTVIFGISPFIYGAFFTVSSAIYIVVVPVCTISSVIALIGLVLDIVKKKSSWLSSGSFVLAIVVLGGALSVTREYARRISCASNMKGIVLSLQQYAMDNAECFPPENGAAGLEYLRRNDYLTDYRVYLCPSTVTTKGTGSQPLTEETVDYVYVGGLNQKSQPDAPILYDKANNHEFFGNVGYVNGRVEGITGKPWTEKVKK